MAADIYDELPDGLKPAPANEAAAFSSEMLLLDAQPFGTHRYWCCRSPEAPKMRGLMENCPETLGILPPDLLANKEWKRRVCGLNVSRESFDPAVNITFDFQATCSGVDGW